MSYGNSHKQEPVRKLALFIIMETLEQGKKLNELLIRQQEIYQYLPKADRAFLNRISRGCVERCLQLDYVINKYSSRKTNEMKPVIRNILRLGTYEILFMEKVPDRAACYEAVDLARQKGFSGLTGFVNGVLRTIARQKDDIAYPDREKAFEDYMESVYSIPKWLAGYWEACYGKEITEKMGEAFLKEEDTVLRVNTLKISPKRLAYILKEKGIKTEEGIYTDYALRISGYDYPEGIPGFMEGWFQIQDESSMLAVLSSGIEERALDGGKIKVLDICGAPGGKSLFYAQLSGENGEVYARDISMEKLELIEENMRRLDIHNINLKQQDAAKEDREILSFPMEERFDIVAADLPCSGLGVLGKKCDIKYRMSMEDMKGLAKLQKDMLSSAASYVKPGGVLIYSTCTVNPLENEENVQWFLSHYQDFSPFAIGKHLPDSLSKWITGDNMLQLFPGIHSTDGFFIAGMKRQK